MQLGGMPVTDSSFPLSIPTVQEGVMRFSVRIKGDETCRDTSAGVRVWGRFAIMKTLMDGKTLRRQEDDGKMIDRRCQEFE